MGRSEEPHPPERLYLRFVNHKLFSSTCNDIFLIDSNYILRSKRAKFWDIAPKHNGIPFPRNSYVARRGVRSHSSLIAPQCETAIREEHLSGHVAVRLEQESNGARDVLG